MTAVPRQSRRRVAPAGPRRRDRVPLRVVLVPGLGDRMGWLVWLQRQGLRTWRSLGVRTAVFRVGWSSDARFADRTAALLDVVRGYEARGERVVVVGASAGAGAALAVLAEHPTLAAAVLVVGKFRHPDHLPDPVLSYNDVFDESLHAVPRLLERIGPAERARVLSLRSAKDGIVPDADPVLPGAVNERMRVVGHVTAIGFALVFRARRIVAFARAAAARL